MSRLSPEWPPTWLHRLALGFVPRAPDHILALTEEQIAVVRQLAAAHRARLDGPSGSGKTHLVAGIAQGLAKQGRRVLVLSPRWPLAMWLRQALQPMGVVVQTIDACARAALAAKYENPPARKSFDDPEFFVAAAGAVKRGQYDLVVGDEWQTTTPHEQFFVRALVGDRSFFEVVDSSRDMRDEPPTDDIPPELLLSLSRSLRSPERVELLDRLYALEGLDPLPTLRAQASVSISAVGGADDVVEGVRGALAALGARGMNPGDVGIASALGRAQSGVTTALCAPGPYPRAFPLTNASSMTGTACDSFAYWLGLERRAIIVVEAPGDIAHRRQRLHTAVSRACEEVRFVVPQADLEADQVLSGWLRECGGRSEAGTDR